MSKGDDPLTKCILSIAGSDSWGGGGIATDLKSFDHFGFFGLTAITCLAVKDEKQGFSVLPIDQRAIEAQLKTIKEDVPLAAIKIGLLHQVETIQLVKEFCQHYQGKIPIVLDPVMAFKEGEVNYQGQYLSSLLDLISKVDLITPNLHEAELLSGQKLGKGLDDFIHLAKTIYEKTSTPTFLKGRDHLSSREAIDVLYSKEGARIYRLSHLPSKTLNGAGCCLSSAATAALACPYPLEEALTLAKSFTHQAIASGIELSNNSGNVYHPCPVPFQNVK